MKKFLMKKFLFIKNPVYLIFFALLVSFIFTLLLYSTIKLEDNITKKMMEISTSDVISIANNNVSFIDKSFKSITQSYAKELSNNQTLREEIEKNLSLLLTYNLNFRT
jgi:hypothetical protein